MYQPEAYAVALTFMLVSMVCWGSWANTMKLAPGYPFQLFYWDYIVGILLASVAWGLTLGSAGGDGSSFAQSIAQADGAHIGYALAGGAVFNVANLLLVAAIEIAGLAVAFPLGIGLALIVGTLITYAQTPRGDPPLLFGGMALVVLAIVLNAIAFRRREATRSRVTQRGIWLSVGCGLLMGSFYPLVNSAMTGGAGALNPYSVTLFFAIGAAICAVPLNLFFMRRPVTDTPPLAMSAYAAARPSWHVWGIAGGLIWMTGMVFNVVASAAQIVGPAISYAIGQGATMVSVVWGVFVWKEFAQAPRDARKLLLPMFVLFVAGLSAIAVAPLFGR